MSLLPTITDGCGNLARYGRAQIRTPFPNPDSVTLARLHTFPAKRIGDGVHPRPEYDRNFSLHRCGNPRGQRSGNGADVAATIHQWRETMGLLPCVGGTG